MTSADPSPVISVVIAAQDAVGLLDRCLSALASQMQPDDMEVIVAAAPGKLSRISQLFPDVRLVSVAAPQNVPRL